ncbi:MAG TPA: hypothetical protein VFQ78_13040, partial [Candidatus Udaeobacter sp.]|nr:hypothetical protein [Candidatus Udaeobacter sp.]
MKSTSNKPRSRQRFSYSVITVSFLAMIMISLRPSSVSAGSATWNSNPVNNQWYNANNWTPATVPDGATDIATFGTTTQPAITISDSTDSLTVLNGITFNSGASTYILTLPPGFN